MRFLVPVLAILTASHAHAATWRYCLAQDEDVRRVYVTDAFQSDRTLQSIEADFNAWPLGNEIHSATGGICPVAISPFGPDTDIQSAINYNKGLSMKAVRVDWRP